MALVVKDRVKQFSTTTGTGTLTLGATPSGFQSFGAVGDGNTTYYTITDPDTGDWEVGVGTYTASGTTLSRDTVLASSNAGSLVNFSAASKDVFVVYSAEKAVFTDAIQTLTNKTISGAANTVTNVSLSTGVTGTLPIANGGTGQTTANAALNALLPSQASQAGKYLVTDGTNTAWTTLPSSMPIGAAYIQFPGYDAPATVFGGTWSAVFDNEGVFFRTPGGNATAFGGGIQEDAFQLHRHTSSQSLLWSIASGQFAGGSSRQVNSLQAYQNGYIEQGGGDPRTASETRPRNRTIRVWVRTA